MNKQGTKDLRIDKSNILRHKTKRTDKPVELDREGGINFPMESEKLLRLITDNMSDMIRLTDTNGINQYVSPSHKTYLGYSPEERMGRSNFEIVHPDDLERILLAFAEGISSRKHPGKVEYRIRHRDGRYVWLETVADGIYDDKGSLAGIVQCSRDITERKQMEADLQEYKERLEQLVEIRTSELKAAYLSLQQSEERFHKAFQSSPAPTAISTIEEGRYIDVNDSFLHVMGYSREELVGQAVHNLSVWDNVDRRGLWMKELHERGSLQGAWIHLRTKEGEIRDVLWFAEIIKVQGEDMMLSLFHDFTERRKIEQELNESREQLRALAAKLQKIREDERTKIARELHDELGQALTALKCDVAWLANKVSDDRALIDKAKDMKQNIDDTVRQIRKISTELRPGILDDLGLQAAIEWQLEEFQARSGITARFASDLNGTHIAPDVATTMFRILQETLTNVIRHAEATQVEVVIETAVSYLAMTVKDDGKGITDDEINDKKSLGILGMKERVMLLGGQLHIYGFPESGTTVNIKIPIRN